MKIRGTDFVMYLVSDLARAARFYRDTLGLPQEIYSEEWQWAEFDCGNITLALKGGSKPRAAAPGARIALAVDDVQRAHEELKRIGARIRSAPVDNKVCWSMEILDPDGNLVILHRRADGTFGRNPAKV
jgi:predicted enzyme related to lactoylglutathione lyase